MEDQMTRYQPPAPDTHKEEKTMYKDLLDKTRRIAEEYAEIMSKPGDLKEDCELREIAIRQLYSAVLCLERLDRLHRGNDTSGQIRSSGLPLA